MRGSAASGRARAPSRAGRGEWIDALGRGTLARCGSTVGDDVLAWLERVGEVPLPPYIRRPGRADASRPRALPDHVRARAGRRRRADGRPALHARAARRAARPRGVEYATLVTLHVGPGTFLPDPRRRPRGLPHGAGALRAAGATRATRIARPAPRAARVGRRRHDHRPRARVGGRRRPARRRARRRRALHRAGPPLPRRSTPSSRTSICRGRRSWRWSPRFAGWERVRAAYAEAVRRRYRFYSYGDAMLVT